MEVSKNSLLSTEAILNLNMDWKNKQHNILPVVKQ